MAEAAASHTGLSSQPSAASSNDPRDPRYCRAAVVSNAEMSATRFATSYRQRP